MYSVSRYERSGHQWSQSTSVYFRFSWHIYRVLCVVDISWSVYEREEFDGTIYLWFWHVKDHLGLCENSRGIVPVPGIYLLVIWPKRSAPTHTAYKSRIEPNQTPLNYAANEKKVPVCQRSCRFHKIQNSIIYSVSVLIVSFLAWSSETRGKKHFRALFPTRKINNRPITPRAAPAARAASSLIVCLFFRLTSRLLRRAFRATTGSSSANTAKPTTNTLHGTQKTTGYLSPTTEGVNAWNYISTSPSSKSR